ncbi:MAG: hypothetical protein QG675_52 [Patescibacteria group bacterium]|nr:hypothetical protein [Patescibacteria group bacterium]
MQENNFPQQDQPSTPPEIGGVELVGKSVEDRKPDTTQKKQSGLVRYFGLGKKKPQEHPRPKSNVPETTLLQWSAPEFVQTHKPMGWYILFALFFLVLIAIAIFTKQYITVGLFAVMGVAVLVYAHRAPRTLSYIISNYGVSVGEKKYLFDDFDSYYEANDYGQTVIELVPNKRFGTLVSLPPAEHHLQEVEDTLSKMLPKVPNREDFVDKIFRKLRF